MLFVYHSKYRIGFTLIEILVVLAVIGILAAVVGVNINNSSAQSRDAQRQSDLRNLQQAIEFYKNREGRYPEQCAVGGAVSGSGFWSGQLGTDYECDNGTGQYIIGLAPEYISVLPADSRLPSGRTDVGYVYRTNTDGSVYKIMALRTVEADALLNGSGNNYGAYTHPLKSCDIKARVTTAGVADTRLSTQSMCYVFSTALNSVSGEIAYCVATHERFRSTYALWGGAGTLLAGNALDNNPVFTNQERYTIKNTTDVICQ
jgi:prepilin-type N-terminal cleavage/methylation domain-containing protein